jgi:hypothetical protein
LIPEVYERFKNLPANITEEQYKEHIQYLSQQLTERKELSKKLEEVMEEKQEKE